MPEINNEYVYQPPAKFTEELRQRINNAGFSDEFKQQIKSAQKKEGRKMFERLTAPSEAINSITLKALCESCGEDACGDLCTEYLYKECKGCPVQEAFDRLAAYEDSELSPEQVQEFAKAEAEGRLVVLPEPQKSDYPGLKVKYRVYKARNGEPVENCFVLRPDKDYAAIQALYAYAGSTDNVQLKEDIYRWLELIASEKEGGKVKVYY